MDPKDSGKSANATQKAYFGSVVCTLRLVDVLMDMLHPGQYRNRRCPARSADLSVPSSMDNKLSRLRDLRKVVLDARKTVSAAKRIGQQPVEGASSRGSLSDNPSSSISWDQRVDELSTKAFAGISELHKASSFLNMCMNFATAAAMILHLSKVCFLVPLNRDSH